MRVITKPSTDSAVRRSILLALADFAWQATRVARNLTELNRKRMLGLKSAAYSALSSARAAGTSAGENDLLVALSQFAREANGIAHDLPKPERGPVFDLKSTALSA